MKANLVPLGMKTVVACAAFAVAFGVLGVGMTCTAMAQGRGGDGGGFGRGMFGGGNTNSLMLLMNEKVREELDLVDDQVEELTALQEEMQTEMRDMFSGMRDMDQEERQSAMEKMRDEMTKKTESFQKKVDEVLLPHQQKRLKQLTFQSQSRGRGGVGGLLTSDTMKEELDITSEQEPKITEAAEKAAEEMQAELKKLQAKTEEKILSALTETQRKKYRELVGEAFDFGNQFGGRGGGGGNQRGGGNQSPRNDF
jgi:hypothetical protein